MLCLLRIRNLRTQPADSDHVSLSVEVISEVVIVEQILIRNLPLGTKAALRARAKQRHSLVEGEARDVLARAVEGDLVTIVDVLSTDERGVLTSSPRA